MSKNNSLVKSLKKILKKDKSSTQCHYCGNDDVILENTKILKSQTLSEKEFLLKCNNCNRVGIRKEIWHHSTIEKQVLTDVEVEIEN